MNSPETTSNKDKEEKMDISRSAQENKDEPRKKQSEMSNLGVPPSQDNRAETTPTGASQRSDNRTSMDTSEPENKKIKQRLKAEKLMKCPNCPADIVPSVKFCKPKNDQYEFTIGLQQDSGDKHMTFFENKLDWPKQSAVANGQCPDCNNSFPVSQSVASSTNKMGGFDIEFSINISKEEKLEAVGERKEQDDMDGSSSQTSTGGTQSQIRNCENEGMEQDDMDDSSSEKSTGSKTNNSSFSEAGKNLKNWISGRLPSLKKSEQSNQTTGSKGSSLLNFLTPPTPVVKVHCTPTNDTYGADTEIMKRLKYNLKSSVDLEKTNRSNCSVIIVFCPVSRSFESEIKSAMEKEAVSTSSKPIILVLMHHTRDHDFSTAGCDTSEVLKNLFYVHVFYHETVKGLVNCSQNNRAIMDIEKELKTYKQ